jgi:superoxide dismutase, Cu-Zn family
MTTRIFLSALAASVLAGSAIARDGTGPAPDARSRQAKPVTVKLVDAKSDSIGTATLSPAQAGVTIALALKGLSAGEHAIHVHRTASCEAPGFTSAGGHFNPERKQHGMNNPQGPHAGDMPNFTVDAAGRSTATIIAPGVTLADGPHSVFTGGGTALVIHEKADDMRSDPAGNAGTRIACGVIRK